jgi:hypothetical protein
LWVGLLARLLVMPFATHSDLLGMYGITYQAAQRARFAFGLQALLGYFHLAYFWLITPLLPSAGTLWVHPFFTSFTDWFEFISYPRVYRFLFLFKLPYLFFDLACAWLLYRLGSNNTRPRLMFKLWWFNPILFFAIYIFGRHEVIALFFILLSIYLIRHERQTWGLLALGIAIAIRYYAIFLLPFYLLSIHPAWKERLQGVGIGLAPWFILNIMTWLMSGLPEVTHLANLPHDNYLLSMKLAITAWDNLYIFPLLYFLLILHRLYNREYGLRSMQRYSLVVLLLLFATAATGQSPQYWTWFLPLLVLEIAEDNRLLPLHIAQIACLTIYSFIGSRATAGYLFASISPSFFWSLPSPVEIIGRFASPEIVISLARTAFSAVTFWMAYLIFQQLPITSRHIYTDAT